MLNVVILIGRLTADPELQKVSAQNGEVSVCKFTVAVDRGNDQTDFIDCVAWRNQAENLCKFKKKGDLIAVEGRLQIDSYDDSQGIRRKAARVIVRRITFLPTGRKQVEDAPLPEPPVEFFGEPVEMDPDDLPF
ncbi:single-strand DNA-binding protein [Thermodesulfitimonas autotrophica]|uniref:Single-stranded DNA-binding protein n=1 Tax=Thermodesulfitimonas autotrophica TaxID=1894989 RepID=A0A3N5AWW4_9THEO|nr:single-stranded DNA-binding protein [Thermodesulfitimonas autotrophica]RPF49509.1 single-strand DNA-binding protein [Thermodesulfitimonas autotrophica]